MWSLDWMRSAVPSAAVGRWQVCGEGEEPDALGGEQGVAGENVAGAQVELQRAGEFAVQRANGGIRCRRGARVWLMLRNSLCWRMWRQRFLSGAAWVSGV